MIRVLLADDHRLIRFGIRRMLEDEGNIEVIGEASDGEEAVAMARRHEPDVVLMDVSMPGIGGLEATQRILRACGGTRVIALTMHGDELHCSRFLEAGAYGYLTKGVERLELISAVRRVHAGQRHLSAALAEQLAFSACEPQSASPFSRLSGREIQIAKMVVQCEKVNAIAEKLFLSPKTVNTYRYRIFEKLAIGSDVELVHLALRHGLVESHVPAPVLTPQGQAVTPVP